MSATKVHVRPEYHLTATERKAVLRIMNQPTFGPTQLTWWKVGRKSYQVSLAFGDTYEVKVAETRRDDYGNPYTHRYKAVISVD